MQRIALLIVGAAFLLLLSVAAHARTTARVTRVCPFSGKTFSATVEKSGTQVCTRLDLKPIGFIGSPPLVPICPEDGFVLYKAQFSAEEIATLRPWVESEEFRSLVREESPYFRIARTQEKLSESVVRVALSYLAASWQVESSPDRYERYVELALSRLNTYVDSSNTAIQEDADLPRKEAAVLSADLNRRIGRFREAREQLVAVRSGAEGVLAQIIQYELDLIEHQDKRPRYVPRENEDRCAGLDDKGVNAATSEAPEVADEAPTAPRPTDGPLPPEKLRP